MAGNREYVYGNVVRKETRELPGRQSGRQQARSTRRRQQEVSMNAPYVVVLTLATLVAVVLCCNYLKVQSTITSTIKSIETQEQILEQLRNENDSAEARINTSINLDQVYQVATEELGMVYAGKDQVITFQRSENEYVRQYDSIPE